VYEQEKVALETSACLPDRRADSACDARTSSGDPITTVSTEAITFGLIAVVKWPLCQLQITARGGTEKQKVNSFARY
jgi:hypothetical protein